jgi:SAM-dependent methyltransferase
MRLATALCFNLVKPIVVKRELALRAAREDQDAHSGTSAEKALAALDADAYTDWRGSELEHQFRSSFQDHELRGKRVLDFGCGTGALSLLAAHAGAASVEGIDLLPGDIQIAEARLPHEQDLPVEPRFRVAPDAEHIDAPDDAYDVVLCFDVVEHIMAYRSIIPEWKRVLAPGGRVLIWWQPYYHPYGHHLHSMIPVPWVHAIFSKRTLSETCHRIYELPEYQHRTWDLDEHGNPLPISDEGPETLGGVNGLTIRRFERLCRDSGFRLTRAEPHGFGGPRLVRSISSVLTHTPLLREFFTSHMVYRLEHG